MSEDVLKRATEALREESSAAYPRSAATRARLLDSAEKRYAGRRRWLLRWSLAIASLFVVGTALARVAEYWPALREVISLHSLVAPKSSRSRKPEHTRAPAVSPTPQQPPAEPAAPPPSSAPQPPAAPSALPSAAPPPRPAPRRAHPTPAPAPPQPAAAGPARSAELELFRRALALHVAHDPAALAAWDAYLRIAERGVLVPEASYNRALCLIRLGRNAEARAALAAFARGDFGAYRRSEAEALLRALPQ
jgi:hypothetical protein